MKIYYEKDADLSLIKGRKVTIVGYGSQGHAHALNLNDSGIKVTVGLRKVGASWDKAKKAGLKVAEVADAVTGADIVMMLMPDEHIAATYKSDVEPHIKKGATLAFAHGFNIHYGQVVPRADLDVVMLFRLYTVRAVVRDVPLRARYGDERSNLRIGRVVRDFPLKYAARTVKRVFYAYFLRDFNAGTLQLASGALLVVLGALYGAYRWINSTLTGVPTSSGGVMLAALPVLVGVPLLLGALQFDIQNVPRIPLSRDHALDDEALATPG